MQNKQVRKEIPSFEKYAIFKTGGKQYQALEGSTIAIEKLKVEAGETVKFNEVLLRKNGDNVEVGTPFLSTPVVAKVLKYTRGPKLIAFRFKRRHKVRVKRGHRQDLTVIRIESI